MDANKKPGLGEIALLGSDFLTLATLSRGQIAHLYETAARVKRNIAPYAAALEDKTIILLFEKPSLRTRVTFEVGPSKMGAHCLYFDHSKERVGARESVRDYAKNLERMVDGIVARVFSHEVLEDLAEHAKIPVINALSDAFHPCQALADYFTLAERLGPNAPSSAAASGSVAATNTLASGEAIIDRLRGARLAYIGDGNNVCASLMHGAAILGVHLTVITPKGYAPEQALIEECVRLACASGGQLVVTTDVGAVKGAQAVYTDTWVSMGDEAEKVKRMAAFSKYRVDEKLMELARSSSGGPAIFMHCLPAHRGAEVTDAVIDAPESIVYEQAENRMHTQNALLLHVLGGI
jgi:ornithine carbamoyltransferase